MNKDILRAAGFDKEVNLVEENKCPFCNKDIDVDSFKNDLSKTEFEISGLCQSCQDEVFE